MKRILINDNKTELFFNSEATKESILQWVVNTVMFSDLNVFDLNERHSCMVTDNTESEDIIWISGDEDNKELTIETVTPIL